MSHKLIHRKSTRFENWLGYPKFRIRTDYDSKTEEPRYYTVEYSVGQNLWWNYWSSFTDELQAEEMLYRAQQEYENFKEPKKSKEPTYRRVPPFKFFDTKSKKVLDE